MLLVRRGTTEFFANEYSNKYYEIADIPREFHSTISQIDLEGVQTFEKAKRIAFDMVHGHKPGRGLSSDSREALKLIYSGGAGVCSDYAQVYTGLCVASGVKIREWGVCDDLVQMNYGHSFSEVFSSETGKWAFIDPYDSIYATRKGQNDPISVTELIDLVTANSADKIDFRYITEDRSEYVRRTVDYIYCNAGNIFFLLSGYNVFKQDKALKWSKVVPLPMLHLILIVIGHYQRFHVYINRHNEGVIMEKLTSLNKYFRVGTRLVNSEQRTVNSG